ncbi:hypothetical protein [Micromonospora sp. NPDC047134]|uniref:hypothetical protein n=1 Tax=Micromonospora sp. NPDC047134 TaxID=3154340 RepID=UPI0033DA82A5
MPELLDKHRTWLLGLLAPRTKQDLFAEQTADLFGANLSQPECAEYLRWRLRLRDAEVNTRRRQRVVHWLDIARTDRRFRDPLIRLLVAESHWLSSAPLVFPEHRAKIEEMAVAMLAGNAALLVEARLRVQAAVLLARIAPDRFARELGRIVRVNHGEGLVIPQVFLEALILLAGPHSAAPHSRQRIARRIADSLEHLLNGLRDKDDLTTTQSDYVNLPLIRYLLLHTRRPLQEPLAGKQEAWSRLRHEINSAGHDFSDPWWAVRTDIDLADAGQHDLDPEKIWENWARCESHLQEAVLPCLEPIRDILISRSVIGDVARSEVPRWDETLSAEGPQAVEKTTARIFDVVEQLRQGHLPRPEQAAVLRADLEWWGRFALDARSALLRRIISRGPVDIVEAVREFFHETDDEIEYQDLPSPLVFCTDRLIRQVFEHIRHNARQTHRDRDAEQQRYRVELGFESNLTVVTVRNTASRPQAGGGGRGMETLRHRLERFGGTIEPAASERPWTYAVTVKLERWRMPA